MNPKQHVPSVPNTRPAHVEFDSIPEALAALVERCGGDAATPGTVAHYMRERGYTGLCKNSEACIIADFLMRTVWPVYTGAIVSVEVSPSNLYPEVSWMEANDPSEPLYYELPDVLNSFASRFDDGDYPDLVRD